MTDDEIIAAILAREGSAYTNHPADRGGPTRYGITAATLSDWRGHSCTATAADVAALAEGEARDIYRAQYIRRPGYAGITDGRLRALVVDCAVLHGPANASRWLQQAAGAVADGVCGQHTVARVNAAPADTLFRAVLAERIRFIGRLITNDPSQAVFAAGWATRAAEFLAA